MDTPGTMSGRWFDVFPSGASDAERAMVTVNARPVRIVQIPLDSHPPRIFEAKPEVKYGCPGPKGSCNTQLLVIVCRTSCALSPRSHARQVAICGCAPSPPPRLPSLME